MANSVNLTFQEAFKEGSTLWVLADRDHSMWSRRLDWYMQFQIARASTHTSAQVPAHLKKMLSAADLDWAGDFPTSFAVDRSAPLLIFTKTLLPNHQTLVLTYREAKSWIKKLNEIWNGLKRPAVRIFLPQGLSAAQFLSDWSGSKEALTFVSDEEASKVKV